MRPTSPATAPRSRLPGPSARPAGQAGMTLIEVLVAMTVAMLVLGAVVVLFGSTSRNRTSLERAARLADNAQYALRVLQDDIAQAGYYNTLTTNAGGFNWRTSDPCATAIGNLGWSDPPGATPPVNAKVDNAPVPIFGYRAKDASPDCVPDRKDGTAILVVRFVGPAPTPKAEAKGGPFLQLSKCDAETPNMLNLGVVSGKPDDFTMHNINCTTAADIKRYVVRSYYVADCNRCGVDRIPTLKRAELVDGEIVVTPLVEGIENFQVEYAMDANGDGTPDRFLEYPDATAGAPFGLWSNVMAVKLFVLARSTDTEPGYKDAKDRQFNLGPAGFVDDPSDGHKRVLLTSLARMMGPAGQRELP